MKTMLAGVLGSLALSIFASSPALSQQQVAVSSPTATARACVPPKKPMDPGFPGCKNKNNKGNNPSGSCTPQQCGVIIKQLAAEDSQFYKGQLDTYQTTLMTLKAAGGHGCDRIINPYLTGKALAYAAYQKKAQQELDAFYKTCGQGSQTAPTAPQ